MSKYNTLKRILKILYTENKNHLNISLYYLKVLIQFVTNVHLKQCEIRKITLRNIKFNVVDKIFIYKI